MNQRLMQPLLAYAENYDHGRFAGHTKSLWLHLARDAALT
jgi:hypothetical protein